jgi:hypothetical protein
MLRIAVTTQGLANPLSVTNINFSAKGATAAQVSAANLYFTGTSDAFSVANLVGTLAAPTANAYNFTLTFPQDITDDTYYF